MRQPVDVQVGSPYQRVGRKGGSMSLAAHGTVAVLGTAQRPPHGVADLATKTAAPDLVRFGWVRHGKGAYSADRSSGNANPDVIRAAVGNAETAPVLQPADAPALRVGRIADLAAHGRTRGRRPAAGPASQNTGPKPRTASALARTRRSNEIKWRNRYSDNGRDQPPTWCCAWVHRTHDRPERATIASSGAGWSSLVARWAHNPKVASSNLAPATKKHEC